MPHNRRCILNCRYFNTIHQFPKDLERRKKWLRIFGLSETTTTQYYACDRHFSDSMRTVKSLLRSAVPDINLPTMLPDGTAPKIRVVNIDYLTPEAKKNYAERSSAKYVKMKKSRLKANNQQTKTATYSSGVSCPNEPRNEIQAEHCIIEFYKEPNLDIENYDKSVLIEEIISEKRNVAIQTEQKNRVCGLVEITRDKIFNISCFYCDDLYSICEDFVLHVEEKHIEWEQAFSSNNELSSSNSTNDIENTGPIEDIFTDDYLFESFIETVGDKQDDVHQLFDYDSIDDDQEFIDIIDIKESQIETCVEREEEFPIEEDIGHIEPLRINENSDDENSNNILIATNMQDKTNGNCSVPKANLITVEDTDPSVVMCFLELLMSYPELWTERTTTTKDTEPSMSELTDIVNSMWRLDMTTTGMRISLRQLKEWYRLQIDLRAKANFKHHPKKGPNEVKFFLMCAELTRTEGFAGSKGSNLSVIKLKDFPYRCKQCKKYYSDCCMLKIHMCSHKLPEPVVISTIVPEEKTVNSHKTPGSSENVVKGKKKAVSIAKSKPLNIYQCKICHKKYKGPQELRMHQVFHRPPKFECHICFKKYYASFALTEHLRAHRNEQNFLCDVCGKSFVRNKHLKSHLLIHMENRVLHKCHICGFEFTHINSLERHQKTAHLVLEGTLEDLEMMAYSRKNIKVFRSKRTKFNCNICNSTFQKRVEFRIHYDTKHPGVRSEILKEKIRSQKEPNYIVCNICGFEFTLSSSLDRHLKTAHLPLEGTIEDLEKTTYFRNNKKIVCRKLRHVTCKICNVEFNSRRQFKLHNETHTEGKRHICNICKLAFGRLRGLKTHQMVEHSGYVEKNQKISEKS